MSQIYIKSNGYYTSAVVISNISKKVEFKDTLECTEAMAIGRSVSYLKQHLPEEKNVDIFSDKLSKEQVDELEYLKHTNFNFTINDESHKDHVLEKLCEKTLEERFEFGNYKAMKRFNSNQQNNIKTDSEPRTKTLDELHKAYREYMKHQFDNYNYD